MLCIHVGNVIVHVIRSGHPGRGLYLRSRGGIGRSRAAQGGTSPSTTLMRSRKWQTGYLTLSLCVPFAHLPSSIFRLHRLGSLSFETLLHLEKIDSGNSSFVMVEPRELLLLLLPSLIMLVLLMRSSNKIEFSWDPHWTKVGETWQNWNQSSLNSFMRS
jgi:hypothetical protein